jgi:hypothetical protein
MLSLPNGLNIPGLFAPRPANNAPVTFRAGKCEMVPQPNGKFMVSADRKRGSITVEKGSDGMIKFRWTNIGNNQADQPLFLLPNDCVFKKAKTGREGDRVYMLKFNGTKEYKMFWMQSTDTSKDEDIVKKVNDVLSTP